MNNWIFFSQNAYKQIFVLGKKKKNYKTNSKNVHQSIFFLWREKKQVQMGEWYFYGLVDKHVTLYYLVLLHFFFIYPKYLYVFIKIAWGKWDKG